MHELNLHWSHLTLYLVGECTFSRMLDLKIQKIGAWRTLKFLNFSLLLKMDDCGRGVMSTWICTVPFSLIDTFCHFLKHRKSELRDASTQGECTVDTCNMTLDNGYSHPCCVLCCGSKHPTMQHFWAESFNNHIILRLAWCWVWVIEDALYYKRCNDKLATLDYLQCHPVHAAKKASFGHSREMDWAGNTHWVLGSRG